MLEGMKKHTTALTAPVFSLFAKVFVGERSNITATHVIDGFS